MKKIVIGLALMGGLYYAFGREKSEPESIDTSGDNEIIPSIDVVLRELTDIEAQAYLDTYPDLKVAYGNDLASAKWHWMNQGFRENRSAYLS